jgi:hypothetical protein
MEQQVQKAAKTVERKFVLVRNSQDHIDGTPMKDNKGGYKSIVLYPGYNEVEDQAWDVLAANPVMDRKIQAGKITRMSKGMSELTDEVACDVVKETSDPRLLKIWKSKENRPAVRVAIEDQLNTIFGDKAKDIH